MKWHKNQSPAPYQLEIARRLITNSRLAIRGPHGLGKTAVAAILILWFALTREAARQDWKIPTTATAWRHLANYLWPEIHKWARRLDLDRLGMQPLSTKTQLMQLSLKFQYGEAFALASNEEGRLEGAHADQLFYVFDEAKGIPARTFDAAEGAFSQAGTDTEAQAFALMLSTPGDTNGRFYEIHTRKPGFEDWDVRHVSKEEMIAAGRMSAEWAEQRRRQWGETSDVYQIRVLGQFASSQQDAVIPLAWVEEAMERWKVWKESGESAGNITHIGVDVGRGGDQTVVAVRRGNILAELRTYPKGDTMQTTARTGAVLRNTRARAIVDAIGIGAGVVDRLREVASDTGAEWSVQSFIGSQKSFRSDRSGEMGFLNVRADAWWTMRELLDPAYDANICLPPDDDLLQELTTPRYKEHSGGKYQIEDKDDIRRRLDRSPDRADAVVMAFYQEQPEVAAETASDRRGGELRYRRLTSLREMRVTR